MSKRPRIYKMATSSSASCTINDLPDELLQIVLKELTPPARAFEEAAIQNGQPETDIREYCDYLKVCVRWRRIYEPFFYFFPNLGRPWWDIPYTTSSLLATLRGRPDLRACVQRLEITPRALPQKNEHNEQNVAGIVKLCKPSVRSVLLHTDWDSDFAWLPVRALKGHQLHTLEIFGTRSAFGIQTFFNHLDSPTLRTLRLYKYTSLDTDVDDTPGLDQFAAAIRLYNEVREYSLTTLNHRGSITSLILNEKAGDFQLTQALVAWPKRLVNLEWTGTHESYVSNRLEYRADDVKAILEPQRESLEEIRLGIIVLEWDISAWGSEERFITFSQFPKLRRLSIPHEFLFGLEPLTAVTCLNAPELRRLDVEFHFVEKFVSTPTSRGKSHNHADRFGLREKKWLTTFGRAVVANSSALPPTSSTHISVSSSAATPYSSCTKNAAESSSISPSATPSPERQSTLGLRIITVQYVPHSIKAIKDCFLSPPYRAVGTPRPWPWSHMEDVAKTLKPLGLEVRYEPLISEDDWRTMVEANE